MAADRDPVVVKIVSEGVLSVEPFVALTLTTALLMVAGRLGARRVRPWHVALRGGLAAMFALTGLAHFIGMRDELINMVPSGLPAPALLVTVTGVFELLGAAGLLFEFSAGWVAGQLSILLVLMFPANIRAALDMGAVPVWDQLLPRTILQVVFLVATVTIWRRYSGPGGEQARQGDPQSHSR